MAYQNIEIVVSPEAQAFIERFERLAARFPTWTEITESEESYPDKHDWYLCYAIPNTGSTVTGGYRCICYYRGYGDWIDIAGNLVTVTHWQILPSQPAGDGRM